MEETEMTKLTNKLYFKALAAKEGALKMLKNERGETNLIAIILILAVVIALVVIFRGYISDLFEMIWSAIVGDVSDTLS